MECLLVAPTDPLTGGPRTGALRRLLNPPPGVRYKLVTDRLRYPKQAANYEFNPVNAAIGAARFALEHLIPIDQKGAAMVHSFFWDVRKFDRRWVHESDQSFGQFMRGYNNIRGKVNRLANQGFSSYLNSRWCAGVVTWSEWAKRGFAEDGVDASKVFVVPPPFETNDERVRHQGCNILYLGREFKRKGGDATLRAFRSLKGAAECRLTFVGPLGTAEARRTVRSDPRIRQSDSLSGASLQREVWPAVDIFILPTNADAFALAVVDAMRRGIPVVTTRLPPIAEVVQDGVSGLLSDKGDEDRLGSNLQKLVDDPALRQRMGESAKKRVESMFAPRKVGLALREVYCHGE
ncbi:MAG: glycosyltransferase family 4 protein [Nitrososphaerota archaeon]|nr:glycosyltransferase family 4 protein [Nitrososphaerota archaeon]MDG6941705.1 glycosyltransferase family 4 protein [Nitrososphaerota archaeon]MDG6947122.1 glycosyltransferase family 4 protein [Nitrososphaerota archaeon]